MAMILPLVLVLAIAGLFFFLAVRAWRSRRAWVKWPGLALSGLLGLLFLAVGVVGLLGWNKLNNAPYRYTVAEMQVAASPERLARGEKLAMFCADCHSSSGGPVLDGSPGNLIEGPGAPPVGTLWAPNLTPGGSIKDWSDGEVVRAIREGVDKDGKPLVVMPSIALKHLSDEDVQSMVAYLRSQPAVEREIPERDLNFLAALLFGSGMFPTMAQEPITAPIVAPAPGTMEYGKYLVNIAGCGDCHGENLDGNGLYGPGVNITTIVPTWEQEDLVRFFREQVDPKTGRPISPEMPVETYSKFFSDADLVDVYQYLHSLEPQPTASK